MVKIKMLQIREAEKDEDFFAIEKIQEIVWGIKEDVVPFHILRAIKHMGGCVYVAEIDGKIVGFVYGFVAKKWNKVFLHSHQLAVLPEYRNKNIGFQLKLKQREHAIKQGFDLVTWTYDPLMSLNGYFNVHKLGGIVRRYYVNFYGRMRDKLNIGIPSDRFLLEWWVKSSRVEKRIKGIRPDSRRYEALPNVIETKEEKIRIPIKFNPVDEKEILIEIPYDYQLVKRIDLNIALKWRLITREAFLYYLTRDYIIVDFLRKKNRSFYVLTKATLDDALRE